MKPPQIANGPEGRERLSWSLSRSSTNSAKSSLFSSKPPSWLSSPGAGHVAAAASEGGVGLLNPCTQQGTTMVARADPVASGPTHLNTSPGPKATRAGSTLRFATPERPAAPKGRRLRGPEEGRPPDGGAQFADKQPGLAWHLVTRREFLVVERELERVRAELHCLKWQVKQMGEGIQAPVEEPRRYNGYTWMELKAMVQFERDPYKAAHTILTALFSDVYLQQPSVAETACESQTPLKPHIDPELYTVYCGILQSLFPSLSGEKEATGAEKEPKGSPMDAGSKREASQTSSVLEIFQELLCGARVGQQEEGTVA